jgi:peptidoglycan/LPS O-acetylase OafA/YrhL
MRPVNGRAEARLPPVPRFLLNHAVKHADKDVMPAMILSTERKESISSAPARSDKIPSLDGIRAVSFLIVFVAHAGLDWIVPGRLGVNIFFFLSGYLITTLMIREREKTGWISLKLFYARRALRIFPPMYAIISATLLYLWLTHQMAGITLGGLSSQLFYYQNYWYHGGLIPGLGPLWSLAVEEHFYLFFPPLMLLFLNRRQMSYPQIARALLWMCAFIFAWRCLVVGYIPDGLRWARDQSDTRADSILFGCVLACAEQAQGWERTFSRRRLERYILPGSFLLLFITLIVRNVTFRETLRYTIQGLAIAPILYYLVHFPATFVGRLLNTRLLARLGILSYSLYLLHATVLLEMNRLLHSKLFAAAAALVIAVVLAELTRILVEKPTERWRKRLRHSQIISQPNFIEPPGDGQVTLNPKMESDQELSTIQALPSHVISQT